MDKLTTIILTLPKKMQLGVLFCTTALVSYFLVQHFMTLYSLDTVQTSQIKQKYTCPYNYKMYTISEMPKNRTNVCGLEIDEGDNPQKIAPISKSLIHVDQLLIQDQDDADIPPAIGNLQSLTTLIIADTDGDIGIPPEIGDLKNLSSLTISKNQELATLPVSVARLTNLQTLLIRYNPKLKIPNSLVTRPNLTMLGVLGQNIKALPARVYLLKKLQILNYSNNEIVTVSSDINDMTSLQQINMHANALHDFPALTKLDNLQLLDLSSNNLNNLPEGITKLNKVTSLHVAHNHLSDDAVKNVSHLTNLISLDLGNNNLTKIPPGLEQLQNLQYLRLAGNNLNTADVNTLKQEMPHTTIDF